MGRNLGLLFKTIISAIINFLGLRNGIVLEMEPGREDNTEALFNGMIEEHWNEKYNISIISEKPKQINADYKNVSIIKRWHRANGSIIDLLKNCITISRANVLIDCNAQLIKLNKKTVQIYTTHGNPIKSVRAYYTCHHGTDYVMATGEFWRDIIAWEFDIQPEKLICTGYPRNDKLIEPKEVLDKSSLFDANFKKLVMWYPTYRQMKSWEVCKSAAIPVIHNADIARKINDIAAKYDVMLVIKPHPAQDISKISEFNFSNLKYIYNDFFIKNKITSYDLLAQTDALVTDYSSVFFDYLSTGKPIGLTFEDVEEYNKSPGFAIDTSIMTECSEMLNTPEDFERFFSNIALENDPLKGKRYEVMHKIDDFCDANSTERTLRWIESIIKEKNR